MKVLLDTHIWLEWLTGSANLAEAEHHALNRAGARAELALSAISLWEAQMLHSKQRIALPLPFPEWLRRATAPSVIQLLPLDSEVVIALSGLPKGFHGDPADRLIVATARTHRLMLATRDGAIRTSRAVKLWKPLTRA